MKRLIFALGCAGLILYGYFHHRDNELVTGDVPDSPLSVATASPPFPPPEMGKPMVNVSPEGTSESHASAIQLRKEVKVFDVEQVQFAKLVRYQKSANGTHLRSMSGSPAAGWAEEQVLGLAIKKAPGEFGVLRPLFECGHQTPAGLPYTFYSTNARCSGFGMQGKATELFLVATLLDPSFIPVYLCHSPLENLYLSVNDRCDGGGGNVNELLGYLRAAKINVQ